MIDKNLLYKYFNGETTPDETQQILDWVEQSPTHFEYFQQERTHWNGLLVHSVIHRDSVFKKTAGKRKQIIWISVAASFLILLSVSFYRYHSSHITWELVKVPSGEKTEVVLPDGSRVWLNSASLLRYPSRFSDKEREVFLDGEAFFEVEGKDNHPFLVHTDKYSIQVLGTIFNVYAYERHSGHFETFLLEGSVSIVSKTEETGPITLLPNEKVIATEGKLVKENFDSYEQFLWREGLISFDGESFETLMEKLSIYYGTEIKFPENRYPDYECRSKFRQEDGIEYVMNVLKRELSFTFMVDSITNTIFIK